MVFLLLHSGIGRISVTAKYGRLTVFTKEDEIEETCITFADWGFGLGRREVEGVIISYLESNKRKNPFVNNSPGSDWCGFLKGYPRLVKRKPQKLPVVRAKAANSEVLNHWFNTILYPKLAELNLLDSPDSIYYVDEVGFPLSDGPRFVLARRGDKTPQSLLGRSGRENITVQVCGSATGEILPPYIVYKGKKLMHDTRGGPKGARLHSIAKWVDDNRHILRLISICVFTINTR